jgi:hypothetical protein
MSVITLGFRGSFKDVEGMMQQTNSLVYVLNKQLLNMVWPLTPPHALQPYSILIYSIWALADQFSGA